jgi:hypothetical protein
MNSYVSSHVWDGFKKLKLNGNWCINEECCMCVCFGYRRSVIITFLIMKWVLNIYFKIKIF